LFPCCAGVGFFFEVEKLRTLKKINFIVKSFEKTFICCYSCFYLLVIYYIEYLVFLSFVGPLRFFAWVFVKTFSFPSLNPVWLHDILYVRQNEIQCFYYGIWVWIIWIKLMKSVKLKFSKSQLIPSSTKGPVNCQLPLGRRWP